MWAQIAAFAANKLKDKNQQGNNVANNFNNGLSQDVLNVQNNMDKLDWSMPYNQHFQGFGGF